MTGRQSLESDSASSWPVINTVLQPGVGRNPNSLTVLTVSPDGGETVKTVFDFQRRPTPG